MDVQQIRFANLLQLIREAGTATALANAADTAPSYLSQLKTRVKTATGSQRTIGDDLCRKLERAMSKPHGWMDHPHPFGDEPRGGPGVSGTFTDASNVEPAHLPPPSARRIPLIGWAHAGFHEDAPDVFEVGDAVEWIPYAGKCSQYTYALTVRGESNWPEYIEGDLIIVDPELQPQQGDDVVVRNSQNDEVTLKRFVDEGPGRRYLKALNRDYPEPIRIVTEYDRFCGVVVDQIRARRRQ